MAARVFIDGEAGTTGLQIAERLKSRDDLEVVSIDPSLRKVASARAELINNSDVVILCLPDEAAREAVSLVTNPQVAIIDASSVHRIADTWTYGFPEMSPRQRELIKASKRISNPGCYPTGFIALVKPLVESGLLPIDYPITTNAISGYSGGGKSLISAFEDPDADSFTHDSFRLYALGQKHKHPPEMKQHSGLAHTPMFAPSVGRYAQGMLVEVPLPLWSLPGKPTRLDLYAVLEQYYSNEAFIRVVGTDVCDSMAALEPEGLNGTNTIELYVFGDDLQARLVARLDNLGKGASGAAVQNLNIVLGIDETAGLTAI